MLNAVLSSVSLYSENGLGFGSSHTGYRLGNEHHFLEAVRVNTVQESRSVNINGSILRSRDTSC